MRKKKREFSKIITTSVAATFTLLAVGFVVFVCYEMHRQNDLSPVAWIGPSLVGLLVAVLGFYMSRAKAKDLSDLEWEKTKKLTQLKTKYPDSFVHGNIALDDTDTYIEGGTGNE